MTGRDLLVRLLELEVAGRTDVLAADVVVTVVDGGATGTAKRLVVIEPNKSQEAGMLLCCVKP